MFRLRGNSYREAKIFRIRPSFDGRHLAAGMIATPKLQGLKIGRGHLRERFTIGRKSVSYWLQMGEQGPTLSDLDYEDS